MSAWIPYAWLRDGSAVNLPVGNLMGHKPARVGSGDRADLSPDWALLSATSQGESCAVIFDRVAAAQGPAGLLMTDHQSARHGARGPKERVYWSANRQVGINSLV